MDTFVLDSLILCSQVKLWLIILVFFSLWFWKTWQYNLEFILKMNESNPIDTIDRANLTNQTKFILDKINKIAKIKEEIKERKLNSKN